MAATSFLFFLLLLSFLCGSHAVVFLFRNNIPFSPASARFNREVGVPYVKETLDKATKFTWNLFNEKTPAETRGYNNVTLIIDNIQWGSAVTVGNVITVNSDYLVRFAGDLRTDMTGMLYHENAHVWQGIGPNANRGLVEGIADFVRLKAGLMPKVWVKPGEGNKWDEGYGGTCRFLEYLESLKPGFVAALNKKMKGTYSDSFFAELIGKPVGQLWQEYKGKYGQI